MKGQHEILSAVLITGILLGTVTAVYYWGMPLIQKNQDKVTLSETEKFMFLLDEKIKDIATNGGSTRITISVPAIVRFDGETITAEVETTTTLYESNKWISFFETCETSVEGIWGKHKPDVLCVFSEKLGKNKHRIHYTLGYRVLRKGNEEYLINLTGPVSSGGRGHEILITRKGIEYKNNKINTIITISII